MRIAVVTDKKQAVFDQLVADNKIPEEMLKMFQGVSHIYKIRTLDGLL
jgi:hypothetical protein